MSLRSQLSRWWVYQAERFPLFAHGPLVAAFSFSAVCFSSLLRNDVAIPQGSVLAVAFISALCFFLLLRIADEFKDFEEDSRYRPYRPVPRGLVTLRELGVLAVFVLVLQAVLAWWLQVNLLLPLIMAWLYLGLMSKEFFVARWLKQHPITYMWSHMLIMPLIDFYATATDWMAAGLTIPPDGLAWFLAVSFFNGLVIEIGRKIRAPQDEEHGVETYSYLWGRQRAVFAWLGVMFVTGVFAAVAAAQIRFLYPALVILCLVFVLAVVLARQFLKQVQSGQAKRIETMSGVWTLLMYLGLGVIPLGLRYFALV